jgi:hypothetical protein
VTRDRPSASAIEGVRSPGSEPTAIRPAEVCSPSAAHQAGPSGRSLLARSVLRALRSVPAARDPISPRFRESAGVELELRHQ